MRARVRRTIADRRLLERGDHVLVACSGGPDSVALVHVLAALAGPLGITLAVASVDHGLRAEAAAEVEAVGTLATGLGLPFHRLRVAVGSAPSLQAQARHVRYEALLRLAAEIGAGHVAVGHTRDDQAETVLSRLLRGSSLDGLAGIAPYRRDGVIRPLIDCRRADVHAYVAREGLPVVRDPSNLDRGYERVRLRLDVLPALAAEDPQIVTHLSDLADDARAARRAIRDAARGLLEQAASGDALQTGPVRQAARAVRRAALGRWVEEGTGVRPGRAHLEAIDRALGGRGEVLLPDGWTVRATPSRLRVQRLPGRRSRSGR